MKPVVEKADDWMGEGPRLLIHGYSGSINVAPEDIEDFLVDLGEVVLQLGNADAKDFIKALIHAYRRAGSERGESRLSCQRGLGLAYTCHSERGSVQG